MNSKTIAGQSWTTASFDAAAEPSPMELSALEEHLDLCCGLCGRLFALQCSAEMMHGFVAARIVTTLVVVAIVIGATMLVA